jgi:hypothetical protein
MKRDYYEVLGVRVTPTPSRSRRPIESLLASTIRT